MSIYFDKASVPLQLPGESVGPSTGLVQNTIAAFDAQNLARNSNSKHVNLVDAYQPIVDALNDNLSFKNKIFNPIGLGSENVPGPMGIGTIAEVSPRSFSTQTELEDKVWTELNRRREVDHNLFPDLPQNREDMMEGIRRKVTEALDEEQRVAAASDPWGMVGSFIGSAGASLTDPPNLIGLLFGAGEVGILRTIATETLIGGVTETVTQVSVADYYRELGIDYTAEDFLTNVGVAAGGAGVLSGAVKLSAKGIAKTWDAVNKLSNKEIKDVLDRTGQSSAQVDDVMRAADTADRVDAENPLKSDTFSNQTYRDVVGAAEESIEAGNLSDIGFSPMIPQKPLSSADLEGRLELFEPDTLLVDPKQFQFKAEAEGAEGVSARLMGVEEWDPIKAGQIVVYSKASGEQFIVDGHQRLALANRIKAANPKADIKLPGQVLREADGVTPDMARMVAASKNIAEGTGTAIDAAKILRVDASQIRGLPPTSALVKQARSLANLSPDAFGMVINEVVPANVGAMVGRLAGDNPDLHAAALGLLAKAEPKNISEAEKIMRDIMAAGTDKQKQFTLFGEEDLTVSLFKDRATILDLATVRLRNDQRVFSTLVNDAENIETAGNKLAAETNLQRKDQNVKALETLQALAHRKGGISDALTAAARKHADGGTLSSSIDQFVDAVRRRVELGDFEGVTARPGGRASAVDARDPASIGTRIANELEDLKKFDDPDDVAVLNQVDELMDELGLREPTAKPEPAIKPGDEIIPDVIKDTRGTGVRFHGTRTPIESLDEFTFSSQNIYGQGFYTTDALDIANGYAKKAGTVYSVIENKSVKLFDMEKPLTNDLKRSVMSHFDDWIGEEDLSSNFGMRELFDDIRNFVDEPADDIQERFDAVQNILEQQGFGGYRHVGGIITKRKPHEVKIFWNPRDDISIEKVIDRVEIEAAVKPEPVEVKISDELTAKLDEPTITGFDVDEAGVSSPRIGRVGDVVDEIKADRDFLEQLEICSS